MDKLFIALRDSIKTNVPEVKYIDWDFGQLDGETGAPVNVPAVLIDIEDMQASAASKGLDMMITTVVLRCGFRLRGRSDSNAPEHQSNTALEFLNTLANIAIAVDGLTTENTGPLEMMSLERVKTPDINIYEYRFTTTYYRKGNLVQNNTTPKPPLDIQ